MSVISSVSFTLLIIMLVFPFACKWFLTKYPSAWSELIDIIRSAGKDNVSNKK